MKKFAVMLALCFGLLCVSAVRAQNNAELKGNYAFTFDGLTTGDGTASTPFAGVGRFTADGAGNLTNGELDTNGVGAAEKLVAQAFTGTYSIGADHRGIMNLNIPGGGTLAFAMLANGNAKWVEVDASGGHGTVGSGSIEKVDTSAYNTARINGDYAFGVAGLDGSNNRTAIAGRLSANGGGMFSSGVADVNQAGQYTSAAMILVATYSVSDTNTGRGVLTLPGLLGVPPQNLNFVFYVVNAGKFFAMEVDAVAPAAPLLNGAFQQQQTPPLTGFTAASLNGNSVMHLTGRQICPGGAVAAPNVIAGLLNTNGLGIASLTYDQNCGGGATSITGLSGSYSVSGNGRVSFRLGSSSVAAYLVSANQGFYIVPDGSVLFGYAEPQTTGAASNASVSGRYAGVVTTPAAVKVSIYSGEFNANGAGSLTGTKDIGAPSGASLGVAVSANYSISSSPTNGRGTISGSIGGNGVIYAISPTKFLVIPLSDANPAVLMFEQ